MRALVAVLSLLVVSAPARAQDAEPAAELVEALFSMIGAGAGDTAEVEVVVGEGPPRVAADPLPAGAVVLGGMTLTPPGSGSTSGFAVLLARLDADPEAASAAYVASLPDGWTASEKAYQSGGFDLCGPDGGRTVLFAPRRLGGTYVSVADESEPCPDGRGGVIGAAPPTEIGDGEIIDEPALSSRRIVLPDPFPEAAFADRDQQGFGFSREGLRGGYQQTEIKEGTSVEAVAGLAADAFEADGWTRLGDTAAGEAKVSTWRRTEAAEFDDQPDTVTFATVVVQPTGEGTVEVLVTATR